MARVAALLVAGTAVACATNGQPADTAEGAGGELGTGAGAGAGAGTGTEDGAQAGGACVTGGCSGELCVEAGKGPSFSPCIYKAEFACYKTARCERGADGACGWVKTPELEACLANPPSQ